MSFLKPQDFAETYGIKYSTLRVHIRRKKIIKTDDFIDTELATNKIYIQENANKTKQEPEPATLKKNSKAVTQKSNPPITKGQDKTIGNLSLRKQKADTLKAEREAEYKLLQIQKMQGKLMPVELVEKTQLINIQSIFRTFESSCENIATIYNERLGGDRSDLADMITRMRQELHRSIKDAEEKSAEEITELLKEYSQTLNRGEKK